MSFISMTDSARWARIALLTLFLPFVLPGFLGRLIHRAIIGGIETADELLAWRPKS